jgi:MurNAc alpha-1-phosphate uridylyltransferase
MRAMILAAGRGERMRPLTDTCPKPLLKINGLALIEYHLIALHLAGITEIVINHAWLGDKIENYLGNGEKYGVSISYSPEFDALETAGGIIQAMPLLFANSTQKSMKNHTEKVIENSFSKQIFLVINGDIFTDYNYVNLVEYAKNMTSNQAHLVMVENPKHNPQGDFCLEGKSLTEQTAIDTNASKFTFSGIGLYQASFFSGLKKGKRALGPLLRSTMKKGAVSGELYKGQWTDVGTVERLEEINKSFS